MERSQGLYVYSPWPCHLYSGIYRIPDALPDSSWWCDGSVGYHLLCHWIPFGKHLYHHQRYSVAGCPENAASVNKYHNVSLGSVLIAADFCIIGSCMFFPQFGSYLERAHKVMFGFCVMAMENYVLDYVMNARRQSVQFFIFSSKWQEIANAIGTQMNHGVTILDGHGWYTGKKSKVLCILAKKNESVNMFRLIKMIDPNAFVSQSSVIGVYGEGFEEMKVRIKETKKKNEDSIRNQQPAQTGGNT